MIQEPTEPATRLPNLLIVDDRHENLLAMEDLLGDIEAKLHTAKSGTGALKKCSQTDFALILLDVQMPEMDGFEVAENLRSVKKTSATPIIFVTANEADHERILHGYKSGAVDFLKKPVTPEILISKVQVFLEIDNQKRQLAALNKQMKEFVAIVSHDLRSPIAGIMSLADPGFLTDFETKEELKELLDHVNKSARNCAEIVADLLDLMAIETGHITVTKTPFNVSVCCTELVEGLKERARSKGVKLMADIGENLMVNADKFRIIRVLDNLINNAIKFTSSGDEITLQVKAALDSVKIIVKDTGVGIQEADLSKLFAKHISHSTRGTQGEQGTGFGLPLCQSIVAAHGSGINVTSVPGEGSEFSFVLEMATNESGGAL